MKKIDTIKTFLEVEELSKLEQGAVHGGEAQEKQKIKVKCSCNNCSCTNTLQTQL